MHMTHYMHMHMYTYPQFPLSSGSIGSEFIYQNKLHLLTCQLYHDIWSLQESPAIADKPMRCESMQKMVQFDVLTTLSL